ncbi:MAG: hypothetical protein ACTH0S_11375 [Senegalia sp. (in: firmicutes)]
MKKNKSLTYLFPLINDILKLDNTFYTESIVNSYLFSNKYEDNYFYILVDFNFTIPDFLEKEEELKRLDIFVESYDINEDQVLFVFEYPKAYLHEYKSFINGKYSKFKMDAKTKILKFFNNIYTTEIPKNLKFINRIKHILFKNSILKKELEEELAVTLSENAELSSIIDINEETIIIK